MFSIKHRVIIETNPENVFAALNTQAGLSAWWTRAETSGELNSIATFFFGPNGEHQIQMRIVEREAAKRVVWQCQSGPWAGTEQFSFLIEADERGAALTFENSGWQAADDFYAHCNSKWGFFFTVSLKSYLETGQGQPSPMDPNI